MFPTKTTRTPYATGVEIHNMRALLGAFKASTGCLDDFCVPRSITYHAAPHLDLGGQSLRIGGSRKWHRGGVRQLKNCLELRWGVYLNIFSGQNIFSLSI